MKNKKIVIPKLSSIIVAFVLFITPITALAGPGDTVPEPLSMKTTSSTILPY